MNARAMLEQAVAENASDIFLVAGRPLSLRKNGVLSMENEERLLPDDTAAFLKEIYELADNRDMRSLLSHGDDDFLLPSRAYPVFVSVLISKEVHSLL